MTFFLALLVLALGAACLILLSRQGRSSGPSEAEIKAKASLEAQAQFEEWRNTERESIREAAEAQLAQSQELMTKQLAEQVAHSRDQITKQLTAQLEVAKKEWLIKEEKRIREDAAARSKSVRIGHMTEHLTPYLPDFSYNPKDARFLGAPTDLIVFDGLDEGELSEIVFIEVKTGKSTMNKRERQVRDAIKNGRVRFQELRIKTPHTTNQ